MKYTQDALVKLWRMAGKSVSEVQDAVKLMLYQHSTQKNDGVETPHGWLYQCLRFSWQKGFDCYYQLKLPYFKTGSEIDKFVDGLCESRCQT
jgi:hypothetical protein